MTGNLFAAPEPAAEAAKWYTAHCDGGSRGNPGPSGYGAVIEDPQGRVVARLSEEFYTEEPASPRIDSRPGSDLARAK
ncbi:MAG TPA: hypothetical protein VKG86_06915 [Terracidiphilus sp.]|nr:hypothetical protein [Terracidiphilus sp.]